MSAAAPVPDATVTRERAGKDLSAIVELRKSEAFNGYFLRRLDEKIARNWKSHKYDAMTPVDREALRQQTLALEEIKGWISDTEIASASAMAKG